MYFAAEIGDFDLYVRPIPKYDFHNLSPTELPNVKILFNCDIQSSHEQGSLWCQTGASAIRYRINKTFKPLLKIDKITFTKI